jgi:hypothetical protein
VFGSEVLLSLSQNFDDAVNLDPSGNEEVYSRAYEQTGLLKEIVYTKEYY